MQETKHVINNQSGGTLVGGLNEETKEWKVKQDEKPFLEQAKRDREASQNSFMKNGTHYRKAFTIPDIVAIDILHRYGIDVHADTFLHDKDAVQKVFKIMKTEYPLLMSY